jgi:hypothetical protein
MREVIKLNKRQIIMLAVCTFLIITAIPVLLMTGSEVLVGICALTLIIYTGILFNLKSL